MYVVDSLCLIVISLTLVSVGATSKRDDFDIVRALLPVYGGLRFDKFISKATFEKVVVRVAQL